MPNQERIHKATEAYQEACRRIRAWDDRFFFDPLHEPPKEVTTERDWKESLKLREARDAAYEEWRAAMLEP